MCKPSKPGDPVLEHSTNSSSEDSSSSDGSEAEDMQRPRKSTRNQKGHFGQSAWTGRRSVGGVASKNAACYDAGRAFYLAYPLAFSLAYLLAFSLTCCSSPHCHDSREPNHHGVNIMQRTHAFRDRTICNNHSTARAWTVQPLPSLNLFASL